MLKNILRGGEWGLTLLASSGAMGLAKTANVLLMAKMNFTCQYLGAR